MKPRFLSALKSLSICRPNALSATCLVVLLVIPTCAYAIFGVGDIVFDPSNYAEAVAELDQDIQIVQQAIQTYNLLQSELRIISSRPWQTIATTLGSIAIQDLGPAAGPAAQAIVTAANGVSDPSAAWLNGTMAMPMNIVNPALSSVLTNTSAPAHTTAIEMTDAFATDALRTIGSF